jgi:hypothetical protein
MHALPFINKMYYNWPQNMLNGRVRSVSRTSTWSSASCRTLWTRAYSFTLTLNKGTLARGMRLTFEWRPVRLRCLTCGQAFPLQDDLTCPTCQMVGGDMVAEREFYMDSQVE